MLASKRVSQRKISVYLAIIGILAAALLLYGIKYYLDRRLAEEGALVGADGSFDLSNYAVIVKPKFGIERLKNFDLNLFDDTRFKVLSEFPKSSSGPSPVGKKNPFESPANKPASSTIE